MDSAARALSGAVVGDPAATWTTIVDAGWLGAALPEEIGGLGLGAEAQGAIAWSLGNALAPGPFLAQTAALAALVAAPASSLRDDAIETALAGALLTASLVDDSAGIAGAPLRAVPNAEQKGRLLAFSEEGSRAALVPLGALGLVARPCAYWDKTRALFDVALDARAWKESETVADGDAALAMRRAASAALSAGLAADSLGGADAILTRTIDYLKTRRQFDRPLAMFQALKHRAADLKTRLAAADALLWRRLVEPET
ncbi:MAG: hypothetical protein K2Q06_00400, partial [Parvularculaceae bacterium]|nr:hypothetical protein [Parvularculaceae bacterium]